MNAPDLAAYKAAASSLDDDDMTDAGVPKMDPLNAALHAFGFDPIKAARRDEFEAMIDAEESVEEATEGDAPAAGWVTITLTAADARPLPLVVHGVGRFEITIGEPVTIPEDALDALRNVSGAHFQLKD